MNSQTSQQPSDGRLLVENIRKEYPSPAGTLQVLKDVSLEASPGETVAVVGPSGSGKSTLLNIIGSLDKPTAGTVELAGVEVTELEGDRLSEFRSRSVGFVFQDHHLLPQCTALENATLPAVAAGTPRRGSQRAKDLLERVGLAERLDYLPAQLSGGERQRVAIARAMVNEPPLLLCDEPTGNVDKETAGRLGDLFLELAEEHEVILIVVTHDLPFARRFSRTMQLLEGRLRPAQSV